MADKPQTGWTTVAFGDVVRKINDKVDPDTSGLERYIAGEHMDSNELKIKRWGTIGDGYLGPAFHMRFRPGQVLYGSRRTYLRKVAVADFEGICANTTFVLDAADPDLLLPGFLPYLMQTESFHKYSELNSKGSVNPYINFSDLAQYEFDLPPVDTQIALIQVLRETTNLIEQLQIAAHRLGIVANSGVRDLVRAFNGSTHRIAVSELLTESPRNGLSLPATSSDSPMKTVSISAVRGGTFDPTGCEKTVATDPDRVAPFVIRKDDVFVVRGNGNRKLTGLVGLSPNDYPDIFYPDLLIRLRFDREKVLPEFAVAQWNLPTTHEQLLTHAKSSNGIWKVNGRDVREHEIAVPPIQLQQESVELLGDMRERQVRLARRSETVSAIHQSILHQGLGAS